LKTLDQHEVVRVENPTNVGYNPSLILTTVLGLFAFFAWLWKVFRGVATESWVKAEFSSLRSELREDIDALENRVGRIENVASGTKEDVTELKVTMKFIQNSIERIHGKLDGMSNRQDRSGTDVKRLISEAIREHNPKK
jgi:hypothetical protein